MIIYWILQTSSRLTKFYSPLFKALIFAWILIHHILKYLTILNRMLIIKILPSRMMRSWSLFKISAKGAPPTLAFELEADLAEWALNKSLLIPACLWVFFSQPDIVEGTTALWGLMELKSNFFSWLNSLHHLMFSLHIMSSPHQKRNN